MPSDQFDALDRALRRRDLLVAAGGASAAAVLAACGRAGAKASGAGRVGSAAATCVLTPEVTEGPYWISNRLTRRNITDGQGGLPLYLHISVVRASDCRPIAGADVEIWHANALGVYSGFGANTPPSGGGGHATPNNARRFLRGHQKADGQGKVIFHTIYPGWYTGRTPHIHLKVHVGGSVVHTGQLFFRDATSDAVYRTSAYRSHGQPDTTNGQDSFYAQGGGSNAAVRLSRRHTGGYGGRATVGIRT
jgi:protocatechuate 3,4-dioxygenase beta subunit